MEDVHGANLTAAELAAFEEPALRQRSMALVAASEFATRVGLDEAAQTALAERIRGLDKAEAKAVRKTFSETNTVLKTLGVEFAMPTPSPEPDREEVTVPRPKLVAGTSVPTPIPLRSVEIIPESKPAHIEPRADEPPAGLNLAYTQRLLRGINEKANQPWFTIAETAEQIDEDELMGIIALYALKNYLTSDAAEQVNAFYEDLQLGNALPKWRELFTKMVAAQLDALPDAVAEEAPMPNQPIEEPKVVADNVSFESLVTTEEDRAELRIDRVEAFLKAFTSRGLRVTVTAADVTHGMLRRMAKIYATLEHVDAETIRINSMCTWGYLAGVSSEDLIMWRDATKPGATMADVHNSRSAFVNGVYRGWERAAQHGVMLDIFALDDEQEVIEDIAEPEPLPEKATLIALPALVPKQPEQLFDEEAPRHVQLARAYIEHLGLEVNQRAFEELLNPESRGDLSVNKREIIDAVGDYIKTNSHARIIDDLPIAARGKAIVRRLFSIGFTKHGHQHTRDPESLRTQLQKISALERQAYINEAHEALQKLLEALPAAIDEAEEEPKLQQVIFNADGTIELG